MSRMNVLEAVLLVAAALLNFGSRLLDFLREKRKSRREDEKLPLQ